MNIDFSEEVGFKPDRDASTKIALALGAQRQCEDSILAHDGFSQEDAIELGGKYVAYSYETQLYQSDEESNERVELGELDSEEPVSSFDSRMEMEAALMHASKGDLQQLKDYLEKTGKAMISLAGDSDEPYHVRERELGNRLNTLLDKMPEHGKFEAPRPAWMEYKRQQESKI